MAETLTTITTAVPTVAVPPATVSKASTGIEAILGDSWKDFINKNLKWLTGIVIRYGILIIVGIIVLAFLFTNIITPIHCGGSGTNPVIFIKSGKTVNMSKMSKDTNTEDIKDIDQMINQLTSLKYKK